MCKIINVIMWFHSAGQPIQGQYMYNFLEFDGNMAAPSYFSYRDMAYTVLSYVRISVANNTDKQLLTYVLTCPCVR